MARSGSEKRQRTKWRTVRFSDEEEARIAAMAKASGYSFATLQRRALDEYMNRHFKVEDGFRFAPRAQMTPEDRDFRKRLLGRLGNIGGLLNQLAHHAHLGRYREDSIELAVRDLMEERISIMQSLGLEKPHIEAD